MLYGTACIDAEVAEEDTKRARAAYRLAERLADAKEKRELRLKRELRRCKK